MKNNYQTVSVYINLPKQLKDDFKQALEQNGASMSAVIRLLIADYLKRTTPPSKSKIIKKSNKNCERKC